MGVTVRQHDDRYWEVVSDGAPGGLLFGSRWLALQMAGWWAAQSHAGVSVLEPGGGTILCRYG